MALVPEYGTPPICISLCNGKQPGTANPKVLQYLLQPLNRTGPNFPWSSEKQGPEMQLVCKKVSVGLGNYTIPRYASLENHCEQSVSLLCSKLCIPGSGSSETFMNLLKLSEEQNLHKLIKPRLQLPSVFYMPFAALGILSWAADSSAQQIVPSMRPSAEAAFNEYTGGIWIKISFLVP